MQLVNAVGANVHIKLNWLGQSQMLEQLMLVKANQKIVGGHSDLWYCKAHHGRKVCRAAAGSVED